MAAGPRNIRAGRAVVEIFGEDSQLNRVLARAQRNMQAFGASARALGASMLASVSATVAPIAAVSLKAASDANEIRNRFNQVFGDQAESAGRFADALGEAVGRSGTRLRSTMSEFQAFFVGLGFGAEQARELSQQLTALALDFASFNNLSDDEAAQRFISALSGSSEVVDRFGINLKVAALEQELVRSGLASSAQAAGEMEKAIARIAIISRAMTSQGAVGDATRTAGEFANQMRRLGDEMFDVRDAIGQQLMPQATRLLQAITGTTRSTVDWINANGELITSAFGVAAAVAGAGAAIFTLGLAVTALSNPMVLAAAATAALVGAAASSDAFMEFKRDFEGVWGDVVGLLASGQIEDAAALAAKGFRLAWVNELDRLKNDFDAWIDHQTGQQGTRQRMIDDLAAYLVEHGTEAKDVLHELGLGTAKTWLEFFDYDTGAIDDMEAKRRARETARNLLDESPAEVIEGLNAARRSRESAEARKLREEIEAIRSRVGSTGNPAKQLLDSLSGLSNERRDAVRATVSPVGSLDPFSALQKLYAAGNDKLIADVGAIKGLAQRIAQNTEQAGAFS